MKPYVINLNKGIERRAYMRKQLQNLHIPYEIVCAVEGRTMTVEKSVNFSAQIDDKQVMPKKIIKKMIWIITCANVSKFSNILFKRRQRLANKFKNFVLEKETVNYTVGYNFCW